MINKIAIAALTAASISIPAYAFNWSVDVDRRVQTNEASVKAIIETARLERESDKQFRDIQLEQMKILTDDIKLLIREMPRR